MSLKALSGLRELRLIMCQTSSHSSGARQFAATSLGKLAPSQAKIIVRECEMVRPYLYATFDYGQSKKIQIADKSVEEILKTVQGLTAI